MTPRGLEEEMVKRAGAGYARSSSRKKRQRESANNDDNCDRKNIDNDNDNVGDDDDVARMVRVVISRGNSFRYSYKLFVLHPIGDAKYALFLIYKNSCGNML